MESTEPTSQEKDGSNTKPHRFFLKKVESRGVGETSKKGKAGERERGEHKSRSFNPTSNLPTWRSRKRSLNSQELG
ncbi:unnamed protein product [Musa acuminata subsp. malaccensis]|uniref:(wild Malaysian banana) hypothetical protein n=1 Tax=Musa acuminata subsp. malaccensis TaxID=214687 RepID=A0A804I3R6_MUSAM|nr:unnamed protein product [Musa acuminata subsp. malaccensis]